jgi:hypothetical protein
MAIKLADKTKSKSVTKPQPQTLVDIIKKIPFVSYLEKGEYLATFKLPKLDNPQLEISKALVLEGVINGHNIVTDQYHLEHLFESVYFTEHELRLGHVQRLKHTLLLKPIKYYIDVVIDKNQVKLLILATDIEPQMLSNPKNWLARVRHLKS